MKLPLVGAGIVLGLALGNVAFADESTEIDRTSGTTDSTVMTQTKNPKAEQQQKTQTTKGGRPQNVTPEKLSD
jgi:hypothetical protein